VESQKSKENGPIRELEAAAANHRMLWGRSHPVALSQAPTFVSRCKLGSRKRLRLAGVSQFPTLGCRNGAL